MTYSYHTIAFPSENNWLIRYIGVNTKRWQGLSWWCSYGSCIYSYIQLYAISGTGTAYPSGAPEFNPVMSEVPVTRSLCVCFVDRCLSICPLPFVQYVACPSIYDFWLPLWHHQTLSLTKEMSNFKILEFQGDR